MKINKLKISGFGRFCNKEFLFSDGLNLVFGKNEAGKSTIQNFIKASLYGFANQRTDGEGRPPEKSKYKPWDCPDYGGYIELTSDQGEAIRIERNFEDNKTNIFDNNLDNITNRFEYTKMNGLKVGEGLLGMDRECFENSVFIAQGQTSVALNERNHIFERIINLMNTGKEDESAARALTAISKIKRNLGNSRTSGRPYNRIMEEVDQLEGKTETVRSMNIEMTSKIDRKQFLEKETKKLEIQIAAAESLEQSKSIESRKNELTSVKRRHFAIMDEIHSLEKELFDDRNRLESLNIKGVTEDSVLKCLRKSAASDEKSKRIPDGDHSRQLEDLRRKKLKTKFYLYIAAALMVVSIPLGIILTPYAFIATGLGLVSLVLLIANKSDSSEERIMEYIRLKEECIAELAEINQFLTEAGRDTTSDLKSAEAELNTLYREINEKTSLFGVISNKESRIQSQNALAAEILGRFGSLSVLDEELEMLADKLDEIESPAKIPGRSPDELKQEFSAARDELIGLNRLLDEYLHDEGELAELEESLASSRERLGEIELERQALELAEQLIGEASKSLKGNIFPLINEKMGELISIITKGRHQKLLAGLGKTMNTEFDDNARTIWNFSDGTIEQMYLALRLAVSDVMSDNESLPILIDEAFAYYDEERLRSSLELLYDISKTRQVIIFTCRESEPELAAVLGKVNLIEL